MSITVRIPLTALQNNKPNIGGFHFFLTAAMLIIVCIVKQEASQMPGTACGLFIIDFVARPFAKIYEKIPFVMFVVLIILYGTIAYFVLKSSFFNKEYKQY